MKPALQLRLGQQLTLTPQLRQAIRLLQLSTIELEAEITSAVEANPLLEMEEGGEDGAAADGSVDGAPVAETTAEAGPDAEAGGEPAGESATVDDSPLDIDPSWDEDFFPGNGGSSGSGSGSGSDDFIAEGAGSIEPEDLLDHLLWQLNLTPMSDRDRAIAVALIEAIGADGYLREPMESVQACLRPEIEAEPEEIEAVLHRIQHFDPVGVGARSLSECLLVQLSTMEPGTDGLALARRLAEGHLEALAKLGPERLARDLDVSPERMQSAVQLLRALDPKPGSQIAGEPVEYIAPDAFAIRQNGVWKVALAPGSRPRLGINRHYESLIARAGKGDAAYLRGQLQEARWLIKSLETRADTLLRVAEAIVRQQTGFLEHGPEAMRPLTLREIADELSLHESTISRVTTRKYLHTPRGTFEFKHFFSSSLSTTDGGTASSTAIQAMLKRLIEQEDPRRPLSDARLAAELKQTGVTVARRTVAKYREAMNIPASNERQRLA